VTCAAPAPVLKIGDSLEIGDRLAGDGEFCIKAAQLKPGFRNRRGNRQRGGAPGVFRGRQPRQRRVVHLCDAAPQIDLPIHREPGGRRGSHAVDVLFGQRESKFALLDRPAEHAVHARRYKRSCHAGVGARFGEVRRSLRQVQVVCQRFLDQAVELGIAERFSPLQVNDHRFVRRSGQVEWRALVGLVGRRRAGADAKGCKQQRRPDFEVKAHTSTTFISGNGWRCRSKFYGAVWRVGVALGLGINLIKSLIFLDITRFYSARSKCPRAHTPWQSRRQESVQAYFFMCYAWLHADRIWLLRSETRALAADFLARAGVRKMSY
jgi:hypothetical protein